MYAIRSYYETVVRNLLSNAIKFSNQKSEILVVVTDNVITSYSIHYTKLYERAYQVASVSVSGGSGRGGCALTGDGMPRVTFLHSQGKSGTVPRNMTLLDAAKELGFPLNHDCGGNSYNFV